jgi:hypothetical protein
MLPTPDLKITGYIKHQIKSGETLDKISHQYGVSVELIKKVNSPEWTHNISSEFMPYVNHKIGPQFLNLEGTASLEKLVGEFLIVPKPDANYIPQIINEFPVDIIHLQGGLVNSVWSFH